MVSLSFGSPFGFLWKSLIWIRLSSAFASPYLPGFSYFRYFSILKMANSPELPQFLGQRPMVLS